MKKCKGKHYWDETSSTRQPCKKCNAIRFLMAKNEQYRLTTIADSIQSVVDKRGTKAKLLNDDYI